MEKKKKIIKICNLKKNILLEKKIHSQRKNFQ